MFGGVRDKAGLYASLVRRLSDVKGFSGYPVPIREDSKLEDLMIKDATAGGTVLQSDGKTSTVTFVRRGNSWFLVAAAKKGL